MSYVEPLAARFHFIPRMMSRIQKPVTRRFRRQIERSPNWVLLTTKGRKTGLPREILLPCARVGDSVMVISTYGRSSNWMKNLAQDPDVRITIDGATVRARAEIIDDLAHKQKLVTDHPFFAPMPLEPLNRLVKPLMPAPLRRWVIKRPVVILRPRM